MPTQVLHSLPSGKQGCSAIAFSPCGNLLAGALKSGLGDFHINIYNVNSGAVLCIGRGHDDVIYSLEWSSPSNDGGFNNVSNLLLSASSDGSARLWRLQATNNDGPTLQLVLEFEWHHVPSPCFVYCAIFHPASTNVTISGASDGCMRFRTQYPGEITHNETKLQVSDVAVHSIRFDSGSKRIFCGDAVGNIIVFSPKDRCTTAPIDLNAYSRVKVVSTGQLSVTALQLHPRKPHLLVHTQPNALHQYELRSYLLLNKSYAGVACEATLGKSTFSPDGKWVVCGSEDGTPRLFSSMQGREVVSGIWGATFFHGSPVSDVAWSPTAHMIAVCSFGTLCCDVL